MRVSSVVVVMVLMLNRTKRRRSRYRARGRRQLSVQFLPRTSSNELYRMIDNSTIQKRLQVLFDCLHAAR